MNTYYCVSGKGNIILKENAQEPTAEIATDILGDRFDVHECEEHGKKSLVITYITTHFHEEEILETLNAITDQAESGTVRFCGEDAEHWRYVLRSGRWIREDGELVYNKEVSMQTQLGDLMVERSGYTAEGYPGFLISLRTPEGEKREYALIEVDQSNPEEKPSLKVHVWNKEEDEPIFNLEEKV